MDNLHVVMTINFYLIINHHYSFMYPFYRGKLEEIARHDMLKLHLIY